MTLRQPVRSGKVHPAIVEDFLEMAEAGQVKALEAAIEMLEDLVEHGLESRFAKKLHGLPIWELKTRSRGKEKGGTRVYFFVHQGEAYVCNAEVKDQGEASSEKLDEALLFWAEQRSKDGKER